jgi:hypothetical protein
MTHIKKIKLYKKVGEEFVFMQIFNSSKDCCEYLNVDKSGLSSVLTGSAGSKIPKKLQNFKVEYCNDVPTKEIEKIDKPIETRKHTVAKELLEYFVIPSGLSQEEVLSKIESYNELVLQKVLLHIETAEPKIYSLKNLDLFNHYAK